MVKTQINFHLSERLRKALDERAAADNATASDVIRKALAEYLGVDLVDDAPNARPTKYSNEEERRAARRNRAAERRARQDEDAKIAKALRSLGPRAIRELLVAQEGQEDA